MGAPAPNNLALIVFCSFGESPRPPEPSGKCTHAMPRSYCAPRNSAGGVDLGSCCARRSSHSCVTRCSSGVNRGSSQNLTDRSSVPVGLYEVEAAPPASAPEPRDRLLPLGG